MQERLRRLAMTKGEDLRWLNVDRHASVGAWHEEMKARGIGVPLQLCHGVDQAMRKLGKSFPETFRYLWDNDKIIVAGRSLIYDLSANRLWADAAADRP
jgi:hypothetical protein